VDFEIGDFGQRLGGDALYLLLDQAPHLRASAEAIATGVLKGPQQKVVKNKR
jgi:hypothetical protein